MDPDAGADHSDYILHYTERVIVPGWNNRGFRIQMKRVIQKTKTAPAR